MPSGPQSMVVCGWLGHRVILDAIQLDELILRVMNPFLRCGIMNDEECVT